LTGRKLDFAIIAMMAAAIVYLVVDNYVLDQPPIQAADIGRSIAVLPFRSRSNVEEDAFFVDGMHDDLLTQLSRISSFDKVISRTSTERYRDTTLPIREIGETLGVATILEGGMQRAGNNVRINVQLIDTQTDEHLWARTYDKELTVENLFDIQSEITREIVTALHGALSQQDADALQSRPTTSFEAYEEYVHGRQEIAKRTGEAIQLGKAHFEKALELDRDYELAWVGLADAYALLPEHAGVKLEDTLLPREEAIDKALSLNPVSGEAYANLGNLRHFQSKLEESETYFLRAIELNSNYATAYHWYSLYLNSQARSEEALAQLRKAVELDPLAPILQTNLGSTLRLLGRVEESESVLRAAIKNNPDFPLFYAHISAQYLTEGLLAEALVWMQAGLRLNPMSPGIAAAVCSVFLNLGDDASAERCADEFEQAFPGLPNFNRANLSFSRGQIDDLVAQVEMEVEKSSNPAQKIGLVQAYMMAGRFDDAKNIISELQPEMFGTDNLTIDLTNVNKAILAGAVLFGRGEQDRANYIFDQCLDFMKTLHRTRGAPVGFLDATVHVVRGDADLAIAALREAYDSGWRAGAFTLRLPPFDVMQDNPEWNEIVELYEADLARQRQWYEEHKDDPLF
jgi:TolB-like protein/Tfp pilus assembly protein PilF